MERNPLHPMRAALWLILPALLASSCDFQPKILGAKGKLDFSTLDTSANAFQFNFALLSTSTTNQVEIQGAGNSRGGVISTCNLNGTACQCELLLASTGAVVETTTASNISYDEKGNYFRCRFSTNVNTDRKSTRLNSSHSQQSRMPSSA